MLPPNVPENLTEAMLEEAVSQAVEEGTDIENCRFYGDSLPELPGEVLEFSGCCFEKCTFRPCGAGRSGWRSWTACWESAI